MYCRVGITDDVKESKRHWETKYPKLDNWQIIEEGLTYDEAIIAKKKYATDLAGVTSSAEADLAASGGPPTTGPFYSVYYFE